MLSQLITPPLSDCSELDLSNYYMQLLSFRQVLCALASKRPLSVEFICELQLINQSSQYTHDITHYQKECQDPRRGRKSAEPLKPGFIRASIMGMGVSASKKSNAYSREGIAELLQLIRDEAKQTPQLPEFHGTWFGTTAAMTGKAPVSEIHRHETITDLQDGKSDAAYAEKVFNNISDVPYTILFYRTDSRSDKLQETITTKLKSYIDNFNREIESANNDNARLKLIVKFIKQCLRIHPLNDANHRVFVKDILNYLLLKYNLGVALFENRRQFIFVGTTDTEEALKSNIRKIEKADKATFCRQLFAEIELAIKTHVKSRSEFSIEIPEVVVTPRVDDEWYKLCQTHDKAEFICRLGELAPKLTRDDILELFLRMKQHDGQFNFIHVQKNRNWDNFRLFFKSYKNPGESFWHTATYQKAIKILKEAYLRCSEPVDNSNLALEEEFVDYVRGNSPMHFATTSTHDTFYQSY